MADKKAAMKRAMGETKESKPEKRHVHKMEIERGAKGGFVVHNQMRGEENKHTEHRTGPHVIASTDDLHDHVDEHMGDQPDAGAGEAPGGADPQAGGAAAPGAAQMGMTAQGM